MMEALPAIKTEMQFSMDDIKKYIAPKATDKELFIFMGIAKSYGLNPLKREIHFVKRKYKDDSGQWVEQGSTIVGYEVYLKRAERTGKLDGWKCWIAKDDIGEKAIIEIKRKDQSHPIHWEVYRKEFDTGKSTWAKMPSFMLRKVCIAQGFRLAFPDDLGGMPYIPEELPQTSDTTSEQLPTDTIDIQAENGSQPSQDSPLEDVPDFPIPEDEKPKITPSQKKLEALLNEAGIDREDFKRWLYSIEYLNKNADGKLSMKDVKPNHLKALLDKWDGAKTKFSLWQDERNKAS